MKISLKVILLTLCIFFVLSSEIFALDEIFQQADGWRETGKNEAEKGLTMDTEILKKASTTIYNILFGVGVAAAIIVGAILGIQFMTAGVDKKVEVKQALVPYVVSCIVIFGAFGIWKLVVTLLGGLGI